MVVALTFRQGLGVEAPYPPNLKPQTSHATAPRRLG